MRLALIVPENSENTKFGETYILRFLAKALRNLNHTVAIFSQEEFISDDFDLIISGCLTWDPRPYKPPKIYWCFSALVRILQDTGPYVFPDRINAYDAYLIPSMYALPEFQKKYKPKPVETCLLAADPDFFSYQGVKEEYLCDLAFVGSKSGRGDGDIFPTLPEGIKMQIWGYDWPDNLPNYRGWATIGEVPKIYSSACFVMGNHKMEFRQSGFIVTRVFEVLATGARFLTDMPVGMGELFTNMVDLIWYDTPKELFEILKDWKENPAKYYRIGRSAREKILASHTYAHRAEFIIKFAEKHFFKT